MLSQPWGWGVGGLSNREASDKWSGLVSSPGLGRGVSWAESKLGRPRGSPRGEVATHLSCGRTSEESVINPALPGDISLGFCPVAHFWVLKSSRSEHNSMGS